MLPHGIFLGDKGDGGHYFGHFRVDFELNGALAAVGYQFIGKYYEAYGTFVGVVTTGPPERIPRFVAILEPGVDSLGGHC